MSSIQTIKFTQNDFQLDLKIEIFIKPTLNINWTLWDLNSKFEWTSINALKDVYIFSSKTPKMNNLSK